MGARGTGDVHWLRARVESRSGRTASQPAPLGTPWIPDSLTGFDPDVVSALTYVVIDEQDAPPPRGALLFLLSGWPRLDELGRVRHADRRLVQVAVPSATWQELAHARRIPAVLQDRPPKIGDTFAMMLPARERKYLLDPIGPIADITADARKAAKAAFYGAVASSLDEALVESVGVTEQTDSLAEPAEWRAYVRESAR
ncbi:hypothetical protein EV646_102434 [Kribbella antiqua]|uniref:Uncharacterized protein n=1 Tax=Kribbella antiqua TaxID=2512217 RepID=A0A4V2S515_9ACTN|nr:hypothetical protein [Kribbella antiqua]TCO50360.1 hypothetical protein EV646_102434 [Kribbella antiqua]